MRFHAVSSHVAIPPAPRASAAARRPQERKLRVAMQISAAAVGLMGAPVLANATPFVAPAGVAAYRLVFVTADGIAASSSDVSTYNTFANAEGAASTMGLPSTTWKAIVSTSTVNALQNTDCGSVCDALPIYMVDGTSLVAAGWNYFFGNSNNSITKNQNGVTQSSIVWTGSYANGSGLATMGASGGTTYGINYNGPGDAALNDGTDPNNGLSHSCGYGCVTNSSDIFPIYAMSDEIIASPIPEPLSGSALLVGGVAVTRVFRRRRSKLS